MAGSLLKVQLDVAKNIMNFYENSTSKIGAQRQTLSHFRARLDLLEVYWKSFIGRHDELLGHADDLSQQEYFVKDCYGLTEDNYTGAKALIMDHIAALTPQAPPALPTGTGRPVEQLVVPLPALALPIFTGKQEEWESFKQRFSSLVRDKETIPKFAKLQHLLNAVQGPAALRLKGLEITAANFDVAWEKLVRRYDNQRIRLYTALENLMQLPLVKSRTADELNNLIDRTEEAVRSLQELRCPVQEYDNWIVHCVVRKLDANSRESWEISREETTEFPKYRDLVLFLERRVQSLEQARPSAELATASQGSRDRGYGQRRVVANAARVEDASTGRPGPLCDICQTGHWLHKCFKFLGMSQQQRLELCKAKRLCLNCLHKSHFVDRCPSASRCLICQAKHHTKLHADKPGRPRHGNSSSTEDSAGSNVSAQSEEEHAGSLLSVRALIDPAAERSFITRRAAAQLNLPTRRISLSIIGLGAAVSSRAGNELCLEVRSPKTPTFALQTSALILAELTDFLPRKRIKFETWPHLRGLELADPRFGVPVRVDFVLGADVFPQLILDGVVKGPDGTLVAQETVFGWILTGSALSSAADDGHTVRAFHTSVGPSISSIVSKLWELDDVPSKPHLSEDEKRCEELFVQGHYRDSTGRFVVRLPFARRADFSKSRFAAQSCLLRMERRFEKDPRLRDVYSAFMNEYIELGHMECVPQQQLQRPGAYLPHHGVFRADNPSKIRVVFNASHKSSDGLTLNDQLLTGPKLQADITVVLSNWRFFQFAGTTDVEKMFRQIRVHEDDVDWQRVLWRAGPTEPIRDFRCTTVTYGTAAAPFLALRVMRQLAEDGREAYPEASEVLQHQLYVDDIFFGAGSVEEAIRRRNELIALLASAGMRLAKWAASHGRIVEDLMESSPEAVALKMDEAVSTLGLKWLPGLDCFSFQFRPILTSSPATRRNVLSDIARTFDPMGWLSPVLVVAKILLQDICIDGSDWDTPIAEPLDRQWSDFCAALDDVSSIRVPRWFGASETGTWHLHAFADASKRAYAAALYPVTPSMSSRLIVAKTKLAPTKVQTVPRLELCAAALLVRLVKSLLDGLRFPPKRIFCWSNSSVVLEWIRGHPSRWPTFVANRVSDIQTGLPDASWRHVRTLDNPADCATRGLSPLDLAAFSLWWTGPPWILDEETTWPASIVPPDQSVQVMIARQAPPPVAAGCLPDLGAFSSFNRMVKVLCCYRRWLTVLRRGEATISRAESWRRAECLCFRLIQAHHFADDVAAITSGRGLPKRNHLAKFHPFVDSEGLIRVGGRLQHAPLSYDEKYPIILPGRCLIVKRLIERAHSDTLHGGPQLMRSHLGRKFWIIRGTRIIHAVYQNCVRCTRFRAVAMEQQMGPLPAVRVTPGRPFQATGLDYAGPLPVLFSKARKAPSTKGYIAIFICLVVRAVHVEVVSDLTTDAFLAAFSRFCARRGKPAVLYSDNATTFKGASRELRQLFARGSTLRRRDSNRMLEKGTDWKFIPPRAPHFGGLWEAAVRSFKHHLRRVIGDARLTFEELSTVAARIEACLNSRPLCPHSSRPDDFEALTPAHFLVGSSLLDYPEPYDERTLSFTSRWRLLRGMRDLFWSRWRREVLTQMQQRSKWLTARESLKPGDMVLLKDDLCPPSAWPLARVDQVHPGSDGLVRVATIRTADSTFTRPIVKLIKLPTDAEAEEYYLPSQLKIIAWISTWKSTRISYPRGSIMAIRWHTFAPRGHTRITWRRSTLTRYHTPQVQLLTKYSGSLAQNTLRLHKEDAEYGFCQVLVTNARIFYRNTTVDTSIEVTGRGSQQQKACTELVRHHSSTQRAITIMSSKWATYRSMPQWPWKDFKNRQHSHRPALQQPAPAAHRHFQLPKRTTPPKKATHWLPEA
ncbi:unnamed protein product [Trichogramma brassicae]|uniref:Uncharacterized protein n=1 Tax=Trichogramma brassicae TaxID=86971 RepID=A0A6H5IN89_9HYME|nr:unnamed protein product [Trichogramma brassicae]